MKGIEEYLAEEGLYMDTHEGKSLGLKIERICEKFLTDRKDYINGEWTEREQMERKIQELKNDCAFLLKENSRVNDELKELNHKKFICEENFFRKQADFNDMEAKYEAMKHAFILVEKIRNNQPI